MTTDHFQGLHILFWLVVTGTWFFHISGIIIPIDKLIFFRGVGIPPTSVWLIFPVLAIPILALLPCRTMKWPLWDTDVGSFGFLNYVYHPFSALWFQAFSIFNNPLECLFPTIDISMTWSAIFHLESPPWHCTHGHGCPWLCCWPFSLVSWTNLTIW